MCLESLELLFVEERRRKSLISVQSNLFIVVVMVGKGVDRRQGDKCRWLGGWTKNLKPATTRLVPALCKGSRQKLRSTRLSLRLSGEPAKAHSAFIISKPQLQ